jgi:nicotinamidase-related amidase
MMHTDRVVSMSSAVVVIDVQESVLAGCADVPEVVKRINVLARRARQERVPVLFIQHEDPDDPEMTRDSPGWQLATALDRLDGDPVVPKTYRDSFTETALADLLAASGVRRLIIAGAHSDYCVQMSALSAVIRGYDVTLVSDGHTAQDDGELSGAQIRDLVNARFASLRAPGRAIAAAPAAEITF